MKYGLRVVDIVSKETYILIMLNKLWLTSLWNLGSKNIKTNSNYFKNIEVAYSAHNRSYHDLSHVKNMINMIYEICEFTTINNNNTVKFEHLIMATYFHDFIYDAQSPKKSVELSASLAVNFLQRCEIKEDDINIIKELILLTKEHLQYLPSVLPLDIQNLFLDADNSILGAEPDKYKKYYQGIKYEYSYYDLKDYIDGRKEFLFKLTEKQRIFYTDYMETTYRDQALRNIFNEIQFLDTLIKP